MTQKVTLTGVATVSGIGLVLLATIAVNQAETSKPTPAPASQTTPATP